MRPNVPFTAVVLGDTVIPAVYRIDVKGTVYTAKMLRKPETGRTVYITPSSVDGLKIGVLYWVYMN